MKKIKLTQGKWAIVDDEDYERLNKWKWYYDQGYAARNKLLSENNRIMWLMHWDIIGKPKRGFVTDHINGDGLDNRKEKLRICTQKENLWNMSKNSKNKSGYKGVYWCKLVKKWRAQISINDKMIHIGLFEDVKDAAKAYNKMALKVRGRFARLNKIN